MAQSKTLPSSDQLLADLTLLHPKLIDLSLGRVEQLLGKLGHPERKLPPVVHITGTNGKGSVTAYMRAFLEAAGKRVHVYTSPHLVRFHERISLAGADGISRPIDEDTLVNVLMRVQAVNDGDDITQFEITTAAAFLAFSERPADVVLLEVGLGGRLDATNVVSDPALTIITPISMDHAEKLGPTLSKIAAEKAGILKRGAPGIISLQPEEVLSVIEARARAVGSDLTVWGRDFDAYEQTGRLIVQRNDQLLDLPLPALIGRHQIVNGGTAVAAALALNEKLPSLGLDERAIEQGLKTVEWPARMQRLVSGPLLELLDSESELWLDGGHNPAAGDVLADTLAMLDEKSPKPVYLIVGMMGQKDALGFLAPFRGLVRAIYTVPIPGASETPHDQEHLAEVARSAGMQAIDRENVIDALQTIASLPPGPKRIMIFGSLYLAGYVLTLQQQIASADES
ncbi:bifunctional folylpolyglutamate synthase/dihydrofolate synthase [Hyphomicrobium methylovorum]|uniref:bifunctional folylpolyglutamate synthase/dihydrofolate synthase n=1 Tax=Hyphomicrobium methylovorum TaxID=84 RepID=UPI0015E6844B|nr:folylpolyglutamate synthase/dihydrofolate synthase family protein [Hyphomicrobium methylovorum]MBA2125561.1 bifunctional folylpolyglutamate synthase/dihydrofolate synthase [Hyphomicrobium methylovorum]